MIEEMVETFQVYLSSSKGSLDETWQIEWRNEFIELCSFQSSWSFVDSITNLHDGEKFVRNQVNNFAFNPQFILTKNLSAISKSQVVIFFNEDFDFSSSVEFGFALATKKVIIVVTKNKELQKEYYLSAGANYVYDNLRDAANVLDAIYENGFYFSY